MSVRIKLGVGTADEIKRAGDFTNINHYADDDHEWLEFGFGEDGQVAITADDARELANGMLAALQDKPIFSVFKVDPKYKSQGPCDTTMTERYDNPACKCPTYEGNLGPCVTFVEGAPDGITNAAKCAFCDHTLECHKQLSLRREDL